MNALRLLERMLAPGQLRPSLDAIGAHVDTLRAENTGMGKLIDEFLIGKVLFHCDALDEIRQRCAKLSAQIEKLTSPPLHRAIYLEEIQVKEGRRAHVQYGGSQCLVEVDQEVSFEDLKPGREVFLSPERNIILKVSPRERIDFGHVAVVERQLPDGRLLVREQGSEIVVNVTPPLRDATLAKGNQVLLDPDSRLGLEILPIDDDCPHIFEDIPDTPPQQVAGFDEKLSSIINQFTFGHVYPQLAGEYAVSGRRSLLMVGPPGCGKTSTMRVVASRLSQVTGQKCRVAIVNAAELESAWVGETQRNITQVFDSLRRYQGPKLLFIDEVDAIGRTRGNAVGLHSDKFLSTWLTQLDGVRNGDGIAVIATTNRKDLLDQALLDRLSAMECHIGRPKLSAAREIFAVHLPETLPYRVNGVSARSVRQKLIDTAVDRLYSPNAGNDIATLRFRDGTSRIVGARELISGRLISQVASAACDSAFERHVSGGEPGLTVADIHHAVSDAIDRLASTMTVRNAHDYVSDLRQDVDIVAVEPHRRKVRGGWWIDPGADHA